MSATPPSAPWPDHTRPDPHSPHHHSPHYPPHTSYYHHPPPPPHHGAHPPPPPPHHGAHPPPPHSQHPPYYHYPGYPPYPHPYPHPHGHPAPPPHLYTAQPPQSNGLNNGSSSETASTTTSKSEPSKQTETAKAKATKSTKASTAESTKSSVKAPKTFRFEGSISSESFKTTKSFDLAGVNILNRKPLDTKTALDKLQRRRETHNRVERKRRDCINQLIDDLTKLLPPKHLEDVTSKCHRVNVLRGAVSHIRFLNESNEALANSIRQFNGGEDVVHSILESNNRAKMNSDQEMSMDLDDIDSIKVEEEEEEMDKDSQFGGSVDSVSRSNTPVLTTKPKKNTSPKKLLPPPVIITDAPSPSVDQDASQKQRENSNNVGLESRPRSNSFASSVGEHPSPRSAFGSPPSFPLSPISPLTTGRNSLFPPGEEPTEGDRRQLSPFMSPSPLASPSLPPISSLAIQSPSGVLSETNGEHRSMSNANAGPGQSFSGRTHRAGTSLPPLMIPEPHHLHPSYQGNRSEGGSKRSSVSLSPNPADQPLISPFMLSPMLPRSPSIGPITASSPGNSPYPQWGQDGMTSPYGFFNHPSYPSGYQHSPGYSPQQQPQQVPNKQAPASPSKGASKSKTLQPNSIFIQEEPWNTTRKRSTSSASSKVGKSSAAQDQRKSDSNVDMSGPTSPTSSVTSTTSYPSSPNPKKRTQLESYSSNDKDDEDMFKRSKQEEYESSNGANQRDSGVGVLVVVEGPEGARSPCDEEAIQALASLAQTNA